MGAFLYYWVLSTSRLIPRWLSGWEIVAIALTVFATTYGAFAQDFRLSSFSTVLNVPILLQVLQVVDPLDDLLHDAAGVEHRRARIRASLRLGADGVRMHVGPLSGEEVEVGGHGVSGKV